MPRSWPSSPVSPVVEVATRKSRPPAHLARPAASPPCAGELVDEVSFTLRIRQRGGWLTHTTRLPHAQAIRVGAAILREFGPSGRHWQPSELACDGQASRFTYTSDELVLRLRRLWK